MTCEKLDEIYKINRRKKENKNHRLIDTLFWAEFSLSDKKIEFHGFLYKKKPIKHDT